MTTLFPEDEVLDLWVVRAPCSSVFHLSCFTFDLLRQPKISSYKEWMFSVYEPFVLSRASLPK